jgi:hypothetical protein
MGNIHLCWPYNGLQLCSVILMSKYVEILYLYLTLQMLIVAQIMFQVYDSSNIHSINICEVYILCQWYANGRSMGEKGSVHILFRAHQWPCAPFFIYAVLHSYLPVSSLDMILSLRYCTMNYDGWSPVLMSGTMVSRCTWFVSCMRPSATSGFALQIMYATERLLPTWMNVFQMLQLMNLMCEW